VWTAAMTNALPPSISGEAATREWRQRLLALQPADLRVQKWCKGVSSVACRLPVADAERFPPLSSVMLSWPALERRRLRRRPHRRLSSGAKLWPTSPSSRRERMFATPERCVMRLWALESRLRLQMRWKGGARLSPTSVAPGRRCSLRTLLATRFSHPWLRPQARLRLEHGARQPVADDGSEVTFVCKDEES
jgi:hypothetical protein